MKRTDGDHLVSEVCVPLSEFAVLGGQSLCCALKFTDVLFQVFGILPSDLMFSAFIAGL